MGFIISIELNLDSMFFKFSCVFPVLINFVLYDLSIIMVMIVIIVAIMEVLVFNFESDVVLMQVIIMSMNIITIKTDVDGLIIAVRMNFIMVILVVVMLNT
jgi:hypothetical protein